MSPQSTTDMDANHSSAYIKSKVGLRTFFNIACDWKLSADQESHLLGLTDDGELSKFRDEKCTEIISQKTMLRISFVLGIYKQLNILLPVPVRADAWLSLPNAAPLFDGDSVLNFLLKEPEQNLPKLFSYLNTVI